LSSSNSHQILPILPQPFPQQFTFTPFNSPVFVCIAFSSSSADVFFLSHIFRRRHFRKLTFLAL
jgi:hypothetical protein